MQSKERPMLLSTPMVMATLEGLKTKTRRTKGLELVNENPNAWKSCGKLSYNGAEHFFWGFKRKRGKHPQDVKCPYNIGDLLWVRETWSVEKYFNGLTEECFPIFKSSYDGPVAWNWKPSIHMRKIFARIWLQITDIKAERLHDITEDDVKAEGVKRSRCEGEELYLIYPPKNLKHAIYVGPCKVSDTYVSRTTAFFNDRPWWHSYKSLWNHINGEKAWDLNPWVWVISFKVLSTTGRPAELEGREVVNA